MSATDEIKSRLDIVEVVSDYLPLRKSGSSYSGFCPFHQNTRTPAFAVFPQSQTWRCFGACAEGGDIFSFVMKKEGWDFKESLIHLAERAGVTLEEKRPVDASRQAREEYLLNLLDSAADYFHQLLLYAPQAQHARQYVTQRGLGDDLLAEFKIGYALDSWDACRSHFNMQGYEDQDLVDAGLLTFNEEKNTRYDRFRNRLMIPIRDLRGQPVGFGARTLDPDGLPKYLNSPQTDVFDKGRLLFGLSLAKRHIREARQVVIVEGYMDVMQAWQSGFRNVVAQMGTSLTEQQLRLVKRYTKRFVLALDADVAGMQATLRSLDVARQTLDREADARFDARGLVRYEGRLKADIRVVTLPDGKDPDEIIRVSPGAWSDLIAQAKPVVDYVIATVIAELDMSDPKAKSAAAQRILPLINDVVDPIEREHYRQLLARNLQIDERVLRQVTLPSGPRRRYVGTAPVGRQADAGTSGPKAQKSGQSRPLPGDTFPESMRQSDFLRQCITYPQIMRQIDRKLALNQQATVSEEDFPRPDDRALWRHVRAQAQRWPVASVDDLCDSLDDQFLRDRVQTLMEIAESPESELDRLPDRLVMSVLDWRLERVKLLLGEVRQLFREAQAQDSPNISELYVKQLRELPLQLLSINRARAALSATGRRQTRGSFSRHRGRAKAD